MFVNDFNFSLVILNKYINKTQKFEYVLINVTNTAD